ncbi:MAG: PilZ domain-containing protein [Proteobacteria bacterium]|nr:PilZ domain-containing protein [Pseudomonadota bacterium]
MDEIRIFANNNQVTFICPECNVSRTADVTKFLKYDLQVKINCKCKCGHQFKAIIERRKFFRKDIELPGFFYLISDLKKTFMVVTDISRSGCKLKINPANNIFNVDERVFIEFNLDDSLKSLIRKEATIRTSKGKYLGLEFDVIEQYDQLGRYLMFK